MKTMMKAAILGAVLTGTLGGCVYDYVEEEVNLKESVDSGVWQTWKTKDPMTGITEIGVHSIWANSITHLGFPYDDLQARFGFLCESTKPIPIISYTTAPKAYILFSADASRQITGVLGRLDKGKIVTFIAHHEAGMNTVWMNDIPMGRTGFPKGVWYHLPRGDKWMVRVVWGGRSATFEWDLNGLGKALDAAKCPKETGFWN